MNFWLLLNQFINFIINQCTKKISLISPILESEADLVMIDLKYGYGCNKGANAQVKRS